MIILKNSAQNTYIMQNYFAVFASVSDFKKSHRPHIISNRVSDDQKNSLMVFNYLNIRLAITVIIGRAIIVRSKKIIRTSLKSTDISD